LHKKIKALLYEQAQMILDSVSRETLPTNNVVTNGFTKLKMNNGTN